jgi:hypothetical protein
MVVAKLDLVILAAVAGGMLWVEHSNRIKIEAPSPAEVAAGSAAVCPEDESTPFSADCIISLGSVPPNVRWRVIASESALAAPPEPGPACPPNNENVPYSSQCLKFMSGSFWRTN